MNKEFNFRLYFAIFRKYLTSRNKEMLYFCYFTGRLKLKILQKADSIFSLFQKRVREKNKHICRNTIDRINIQRMVNKLLR